VDQKLGTDRTVTQEASPEGLLVARVRGSSAWEAVVSLRAEMQRMSRLGEPHATFVTAIAADGREVPADSPEAEILTLGYRLDAVTA
jgi:hypothetical protein